MVWSAFSFEAFAGLYNGEVKKQETKGCFQRCFLEMALAILEIALVTWEIVLVKLETVLQIS